MAFKRITTLAAFGALALQAQPAMAGGAAAMAFPVAMPIWSMARTAPCETTATALASPSGSKAAAILGGQESALERMRRQQAEAAAPVAPAPVNAAPCLAVPKLPATAIAPAAAAKRAFRNDEFLATRLLSIATTPFDAKWAQVSAAGLSDAQVRGMVGVLGSDREAKLAEVNAYVNARVSYRDDRGDRWQTAASTLARGTGDCEDFAIAKYQMLRALGFADEDLHLTLARDLVRNVDHAVLIVRVGARHVMLDDATDVIVDAAEAHDYRAMFSFRQNRAFLHGIPAKS